MNNNDTIHIIIPSSEYYMPYTLTLITSILCNANPDDKLFFHIITDDISENSKNKLKILEEIKKFEISYTYPNTASIEGIPVCANPLINNLCNYKLKIASLFPKLEKVIVLEGDMIVLTSLKELWCIDNQNLPFLAVKDPWCEKIQSRFDIPKKYRYCNTGMFLANLKLWRQGEYEHKLFENVEKYKNVLMFPDQDVFNATFYKEIQYLEPKWNVYVSQNYQHKEEWEAGIANPALLHFAGPDKPWFYYNSAFAEYFWKYARISPFYEEILHRHVFVIDYSFVKNMINYSRNKIKYQKYWLISKLTFGKLRKKYKQKYKKLKEKIKQVKKLSKNIPS